MSGFLRAFIKAPGGVAAGLVALALLALAVVGPGIWGTQASETNLGQANLRPTAGHVLGTDRLGRDILARTLVASRLSLELGFAASGVAAAVGLSIGVSISLLPSRLRTVGERLIDMTLAFPGILLAIFVTAVVGPGSVGAVLAIGLATAPSFARVANSLSASVVGREYIMNARVVGIRPLRLMLRYILPNIGETLAITTFTAIATSLIAVSSLSFLGLGVQPPQYDWGRMLTEGVQAFYATPSAALAPAVVLAITGISVGFLGEALARAMNPLIWTRERAGKNSAPVRSANAPEGQSAAGGWQGDESQTDQPDPVLRVRDLTVSFATPQGTITPVDGLSFDIAPGEIVGIVGESGSGKSMTALAVAQLVAHPGKVSAGTLRFLGQELSGLRFAARETLLGRSLALIFQDPMSSLNPALKIGAQLTEAVRIHRGVGASDANEMAVARLNDVHITAPEARLHQYPHEFSGGMRQRAMIAMGLMNQPALIIADEPTTALDVTVQAQILDVLREINRTHGTAVILISHDIGVIAEICSKVLVMYAGRIVEEVSVDRLFEAPFHPYTRALMSAVPSLGASRHDPLTVIPGRPPDLADLPPGCPFHPRCPFVEERCRRERPSLQAQPDGGRVACWAPLVESMEQERIV